ncbi:MAG: elongation factor Ts [Candidatus Kaiserbacteria bacterium]|nr:elongation factor Ts [Candidatus Kaiserbacteria bacterium]
MADIATIKKLRDETGHAIAKCKEALEESGGDMEKAREVLREKGALAAQKKADRDLGSGVVQSYIHTTNRIGTMVELLCETDFVARNEEFVTLARDIAMHCAAFQPQYLARDSMPAEVLEQITAELQEGADADKPAEVREKIVQGMLDAKLKEVVLLEQAFVKDDSRTITQLIEEAVQKFGERVEVGRFVVWVL